MSASDHHEVAVMLGRYRQLCAAPKRDEGLVAAYRRSIEAAGVRLIDEPRDSGACGALSPRGDVTT